jgi:hypothetical protein
VGRWPKENLFSENAGLFPAVALVAVMGKTQLAEASPQTHLRCNKTSASN